MKGKLYLTGLIILMFVSNTLAEDIAYVLKNPSSQDDNFISVINDLSNELGYKLTIKLIDDSDVYKTNFAGYRVILIGDERIRDVPMNIYRSLSVNPDYYDFCSSNIGSVTSSQALSIYNGWGDEITNGLPIKFNGYISGVSNPVYYLNRLKTNCTRVSSLFNNLADNVVLKIDYPRRVFFGITKTNYWTNESKQLFKNSLKWILQGDDLDKDGYFGENDCNDNDPLIWKIVKAYIDYDKDGFGKGNLLDICSGDFLPLGYANNSLDCNDSNYIVNPSSIELPYNKVDDDCNGFDIADVDNDGYCKMGYVIINKNLQCYKENGSLGTDCNDNDAGINPGSIISDKNCQNKAPIIEPIPKITAYEGESIVIAVHASDPENDFLDYFINDTSRFSKNSNVFSWKTGYNDSGNYLFKITADDGKLQTDINVEVEIKNINQIPTFSDINCNRNILEDVEYTCMINASDSDNDIINYTISNENKLHCSIQNNVLKYISYNNYYGSAYCILKIEDSYGFSQYVFDLNINNVNDPPFISNYSPDSNPKLLDNTYQNFSIDAVDYDNDNINVNWYLNNLNVINGTIYSFKAIKGIYNLTAIASDGNFTSSHSWNIFVGFSKELTCNEIHGYICNEKEVCNGNYIETFDTKKCCDISCSEKPPEFKNIQKKCENSSNGLEISFRNINLGIPLSIGDLLNKEIEIYNSENYTKKVITDIYLYDITKEKIIKKETYTFSLEGKSRKYQQSLINLPWFIDEKDSIAIFVNAKTNGKTSDCNSNYLKIDPERTANDIVIENKKIDESDISCGDSVDLHLKLHNVGINDQNISLIIENSFLKIKEEVNNISLSKYGKHDTYSNTFTINIPDNSKEGNYTLKITAYAGNNKKISDEIPINIGECKVETSSSSKIDVIKLIDSINLPIYKDTRNSNFILINSLAVSFILFSLLIVVIYKGIKIKKTKKKLQKEISKIIKRKNSKYHFK